MGYIRLMVFCSGNTAPTIVQPPPVAATTTESRLDNHKISFILVARNGLTSDFFKKQSNPIFFKFMVDFFILMNLIFFWENNIV